MPKKLEGVTLTSEYQPFLIQEGSTETVELRHIYGRKCENFGSENKDILRHALLYPEKTFLTENKIYQIGITSSCITSENKLYIENLLQSHSGDFVIRYLHPQYNGIDLGIFLPNKNSYSLEYESEKLIAEFQLKQVAHHFHEEEMKKK